MKYIKQTCDKCARTVENPNPMEEFRSIEIHITDNGNYRTRDKCGDLCSDCLHDLQVDMEKFLNEKGYMDERNKDI